MLTVLEGIDRQSPVPYYRQIVDSVESSVRAGGMAPGEKLPSENDMRGQFGVSRATIRQALRLLSDHGTIEWIPNRGAYIRELSKRVRWTIQETEGFLADLASQHRSIETSVIRHGKVPLPNAPAEALRQPTGAPGYELVRLRKLDGEPILYTVNYSPDFLIDVVKKADDVLTGTASFYDFLTAAGYPVVGARREIHAKLPTAEIAAYLGVGQADPVLRIRSTSWNAAHDVFDFYETWLLSEIVPLQVEVRSG